MKAIVRSIIASVVIVAAASAVEAVPTNLAPSVREVVRLHNSGISEDLLLAHISNSSAAPLTADEILYLHEAGISKAVITALIQRAQSRLVEAPGEPASRPASQWRGSGRLLAKPEWEQPAYAADAGAVPQAEMEAVEASAPRPPATTAVASTTTTAPVYVQQPVYVTAPPVVQYSWPRYYDYYDWYGPRLSIGFGFGHRWGHHHHWGGHHWGRGHGIHWRGRR